VRAPVQPRGVLAKFEDLYAADGERRAAKVAPPGATVDGIRVTETRAGALSQSASESSGPPERRNTSAVGRDGGGAAICRGASARPVGRTCSLALRPVSMPTRWAHRTGRCLDCRPRVGSARMEARLPPFGSIWATYRRPNVASALGMGKMDGSGVRQAAGMSYLPTSWAAALEIQAVGRTCTRAWAETTVRSRLDPSACRLAGRRSTAVPGASASGRRP
jgi:hypothetical protein